jgi:hypothetical protein
MQVQLSTLIAVYLFFYRWINNSISGMRCQFLQDQIKIRQLDVSGFFWTLPVLFGNGFNF